MAAQDNARMTTPPITRHPHAENFSSAPRSDARRVRIVLHGALGRMGQRIAACVGAEPACHVVQAIDRDEELAVRRGDADIVIDFSSDDGSVRAAALATDLGAALLVGTTGLSASTLDAIARAAERVPAMVAPNTSLGVAVARRLVSEAARLLPGFDIDIIETHHVRKLDAPSGTARSLADAVARGGGKPLNPSRIHAIRAGDVVGDHEVIFSGAGERVTVAHHATSRDLFGIGALRMAQWLVTQKPGMHTADEWFDAFARDAR